MSENVTSRAAMIVFACNPSVGMRNNEFAKKVEGKSGLGNGSGGQPLSAVALGKEFDSKAVAESSSVSKDDSIGGLNRMVWKKEMSKGC